MFSQSVLPARPPLRLYAVAAPLVLALMLATQASTEETMIWSERSSGTSTSLVYGSIAAGAGPLFMLSCFNGMSIVVLDVHKEIVGAKPGAKLTIELASAKTTSPVEGEVGRNEATGKTFGEASDVEVKPVLAVLSDAGPVTVKMGDTTATLSDQGRDQAVAAFRKNCEVE